MGLVLGGNGRRWSSGPAKEFTGVKRPRTGPTRLRRMATLCLAGALAAASCGGNNDNAHDPSVARERTTTTTAPDQLAWPIPDWHVVDPAAAGIDAAVLEAFASDAEAGASNCLVVTRDGQLVGEWYWEGWDAQTEQGVFSVTKSVTAALVGIAQGDGLLALEDPASRFIEEWRGTPSEDITIRNLLANDSGREWDFETDYLEMAIAAPDKTGFAVSLDQQHAPGTHWEYNNSAIQTLDGVLKGAIGDDVAAFAQQRLMEPLGMSSHLSHDPSGNTITYSDLVTSCRDLARFGLLWMRGGRWVDEQIVPADFVEASTRPSQDLNVAYGYLWWLKDRGSEAATSVTPSANPLSEIDEDAPQGFAALGLGDQVLAVYPDHGLVIARIAPVNVPAESPSFGFAQITEGAETLLTDSAAS